MTKIQRLYVCQNCGTTTSRWLGKCPGCEEWNTLVEEIIYKDNNPKTKKSENDNSVFQKITEIPTSEVKRIPTGNNEFDRVLGGGLVPGSVILIGGEPGIGKSTLLLQIALKISNKKILYVSGEENLAQVRLRAERIGISNEECYIFTETKVEAINNAISKLKPDIIIIDSIQTLVAEELESIPGSVSQIRESAYEMQRIAKQLMIPIILIGHITKDGLIAGPKLLEHVVDTVLQFEGDRNHTYRILRSTKNRFGSTSELGIYEMTGKGLREVPNPSEILISHHDELLTGVAIGISTEGQRVLLVEVQALVSSAVYGTPQRTSTGIDNKRLNMLLAVLEKKAGFKLASKDVFINITGGIRIDDPSLDLAIVSAILSSTKDIPIPKGFCFCAEVGLSGEIRPVNRIEQKISEAHKLGYTSIVISKYNHKTLSSSYKGIKIIPCTKIEEIIEKIFN